LAERILANYDSYKEKIDLWNYLLGLDGRQSIESAIKKTTTERAIEEHIKANFFGD